MTRVKVATENKTLIFKNSPCVLTLSPADDPALDSSSPLRLGLLRHVDLVVQNGKIAALGEKAGAPFEAAQAAQCEVIDAQKLVLMPGLIDAHAHPIFAGSRAKETELKAQGLSYEEIAARGGGISVTTRATRASSNEALTAAYVRNTQTALERGVVLLEGKTGYGLNPQEELRLLGCLYDAYGKGHVLPKVAPTLLGPHASSPDYHGLDAYIQALIDFLPQFSAAAHVAQERGFGQGLAVDIFIERNFFTAEHGDKWLCAALQLGLDVHIHADEFSRSGGCGLAIALAQRLEQTNLKRRSRGRVLSVDHCQYATESDLAKLQALGVTAVALPITSFFSGVPYVDAKRWRASGIRVAIASDFNPGSAPINNLWFAGYLALTRSGFSLPEVYAGVTVNAAYALGAEETHGKLAVGMPANIVAFAGTEPEDFLSSPLGDHIEYVLLAHSGR